MSRLDHKHFRLTQTFLTERVEIFKTVYLIAKKIQPDWILVCMCKNIHNTAPDRKFTKFTDCLSSQKPDFTQLSAQLSRRYGHALFQSNPAARIKRKRRELLKPAIHCRNNDNRPVGLMLLISGKRR